LFRTRFIRNYDTKKGLGNIQKYNKCEALNTKHYLLNDFITLLKEKDMNGEILKDKQKKTVKYDYINRMEGITNAEILKEYQYNNLIEKQKEGELNEKETYILDNYLLSKKFLIDIEK